MEFLIRTMVLEPEVQEKVHKGIAEVIGLDRPVTYADHDKLPYTVAVIEEVSRLSPMSGMAIPHQALSDVDVNGYRVPKGAQVILFLYGVHR